MKYTKSCPNMTGILAERPPGAYPIVIQFPSIRRYAWNHAGRKRHLYEYSDNQELRLPVGPRKVCVRCNFFGPPRLPTSLTRTFIEFFSPAHRTGHARPKGQ